MGIVATVLHSQHSWSHMWCGLDDREWAYLTYASWSPAMTWGNAEAVEGLLTCTLTAIVMKLAHPCVSVSCTRKGAGKGTKQ